MSFPANLESAKTDLERFITSCQGGTRCAPLQRSLPHADWQAEPLLPPDQWKRAGGTFKPIAAGHRVAPCPLPKKMFGHDDVAVLPSVCSRRRRLPRIRPPRCLFHAEDQTDQYACVPSSARARVRSSSPLPRRGLGHRDPRHAAHRARAAAGVHGMNARNIETRTSRARGGRPSRRAMSRGQDRQDSGDRIWRSREMDGAGPRTGHFRETDGDRLHAHRDAHDLDASGKGSIGCPPHVRFCGRICTSSPLPLPGHEKVALPVRRTLSLPEEQNPRGVARGDRPHCKSDSLTHRSGRPRTNIPCSSRYAIAAGDRPPGIRIRYSRHPSRSTAAGV